ncbi:MAG TPA: hypothetical protein VKT72_12295 [Candidatus Baltobacteraceae bacterium]|nr:hypothetical protein [Candidatus Baltobacteraceae bacterium]
MKPFAVVVLAIVLCAAAPTPSPSSAPQEALSDARWTGPMLAPSAGTLPRGHLLVEPYVYDVIAPDKHTYGSLSYVIYGASDRLSVGLVPTFTDASGIRFGDLSVLAQYRLAQYRAGSWVPTTSVNVQESLPTGRYDRLGGTPSNGVGSGAYATTLSLYTQTYAWMPNGRILRLRLNVSQAFSSAVNVDGVSVYGTDANFHGYAKPGSTFTLDEAQEYSITRNWVFALDLVYRRTGSTLVAGTSRTTNSQPSDTYMFAPALEYNWSASVGVLLGMRVIPAGINGPETLTPAVAINIVR